MIPTSKRFFTPETTKILTSELNVALDGVNGMFPLIPLARIVELINAYNLDASYIVGELKTDQGRMSVPVAAEIYFVMSWYRFESGSFEIIAYATSNHDDYRVPFTAVYKTSEKATRKRRLSSSLSNLPSYFNSKGHAFSCIIAAVKDAGFDYYDFEDMVVLSSFGAKDRVTAHISHNLFMTVTWFKMPSGSYEIVSYVS